jgi:stage V sporulation protein SpoVS
MIALMIVSSALSLPNMGDGAVGEVVRRGKRVLIRGLVKSKVINKAIQDIGMGRYNWELFILCGFGWFADK